MLGSALIVFREVLEAALIIGIVLAATRGIAGRSGWVTGGVLVGLAGAGMVAFFAEKISASAEGFGQELFNAMVLALAVVMLAWHQIWMSRHGREMGRQMNALGAAVKEGQTGLHALAIVIGAAILREGSEAVLFLFGVAASDATQGGDILAGGLLGLFGGAVCGAGLYLGLLKIPARLLFNVTGWLITLLAAGMASQAAAFLVQAGYLPALIDELWNSSWLLARSSALGQLLHILIGYDDRPAGIQLVFYLATLVGIVQLSRWVARSAPNGAPAPAA